MSKKYHKINVKEMSEEEKEFLEDFDAGKYVQLTVSVESRNFKKFVELCTQAGFKIALQPHVSEATFDYLMNDKNGELQ